MSYYKAQPLLPTGMNMGLNFAIVGGMFFSVREGLMQLRFRGDDTLTTCLAGFITGALAQAIHSRSNIALAGITLGTIAGASHWTFHQLLSGKLQRVYQLVPSYGLRLNAETFEPPSATGSLERDADHFLEALQKYRSKRGLFQRLVPLLNKEDRWYRQHLKLYIRVLQTDLSKSDN